VLLGVRLVFDWMEKNRVHWELLVILVVENIWLKTHTYAINMNNMVPIMMLYHVQYSARGWKLNYDYICIMAEFMKGA
jgi:hypothetical protein